MDNRPDPSIKLKKEWHANILEKFAENSKRDPEKACIDYGTNIYTYYEVDTYSNIFANNIACTKSNQSDVIMIYAERTPGLVISILAVLKAGFSFIIIDQKLPLNRVVSCINYIKPIKFINNCPSCELPDKISSVLREKNIPIFNVPDFKNDRDHLNDNRKWKSLKLSNIELEKLMYIAITSGTTGLPRAVHGNHLAVSHFFAWQEKKFGLSSFDRVSVLSGLSHDPLLRDILMPLWVGATCCVPEADVFEQPGKLAEWLSEKKITIMHLTPSLGHLLLHIPHKIPITLCLKYAFFGGEKLSSSLLDKFRSFSPKTTIVNCYGATETPQIVGYYIVHQKTNTPNECCIESNVFLPIGTGIEDCQLLILNSKLGLCSTLEEGEICVRTPFQAMKVEDFEGKMTSNYLQNPFSNMSDDLIFKTGDFGYYLNDGNVILTDRQDNQVKIRGYRIDLSEISRILSTFKDIKQHETVIYNIGISNKIIVFIIPENESVIERDDLLDKIKEELPSYMVPDKICVMKKFPITPNGKIDRRILLDSIRAAKENGEIKFLDNNIEHVHSNEQIRLIVNSFLKKYGVNIDRYGVSNSFDSLQLIEFCCMIVEHFGVSIRVTDLLKIASKEELISFIQLLITKTREPISDQKNGADLMNQAHTSAISIFSISKNSPRLIPEHENLFKGIRNRLFQILARVAPDVFRVKLHRWRGVKIGNNVSIGYDTIIESSYPWLVCIGNNVNIGMRCTIIGHFRGMTSRGKENPTVIVEDFSFIGPGVIILPNVTIAKGAVVAAGSVVGSNVAPMTMVQGNPARPVAKCGIPLSGEATYSDFVEKLTPITIIGK